MTGRPRQVCDNCRFRKVKCDRGLPCKNCSLGDLRCQYQHHIRRRGPKEGQGRRQAQLRQGLAFEQSPFRIVSPESLGVVRSDNGQQVEQSQLSTSSQSPEGLMQLEMGNKGACSLDGPLSDSLTSSRQFSLLLVAYIQLFLKLMFPIMPVIDGDELLSDATRLDQLSPPRYALILALCAATRMQLGMDKAKDGYGRGLEQNIPPEPHLTGESLLALAEHALRQVSVIDDTSLDSILASFFLFACYENHYSIRHAWFYLNQSITLAQSLDLTREAGYHDLSSTDREKRRRLFWLLFVTERTFALQHRRSVMLRSSITKPQVIDSECPVVMHDFLNHIRLFESLPWSLYEWQPENDHGQPKDLQLVPAINNKLCTVQPDQSVIESQRFDTLITQQWLRISMWRLAFGNKPSSACKFGLLLPAGLPFDAGKIILPALLSVGAKSKNCHGIGMEQKLYDVGISLADSARFPGWSNSSFEIGPRDLLSAVVEALTTVRGQQSHFLPKLLKHSEGLLANPDPSAGIDLQFEQPQNQQRIEDKSDVEEVIVQQDESVDPLSWISGDDFGLLDMSTPTATSNWEDPGLLGELFDSNTGLSFG
ncbi:hypothetical protein CDV31_013581 [Fusarium ambrosium]|uniref:Zn(2)-C6 fungal-type domain-containing protein n=1 Tax=Fusarium ambrosium TaxID=131363 RepID=A0A428T2L8_9HYPO|nr:hypothetical protein CDV31_013581 [Fusarium ambrosium]